MAKKEDPMAIFLILKLRLDEFEKACSSGYTLDVIKDTLEKKLGSYDPKKFFVKILLLEGNTYIDVFLPGGEEKPILSLEDKRRK